MKRKVCAVILTLIMLLPDMAFSALAASRCPEHPDAKIIKQSGDRVCAPFSLIRHVESWTTDDVCSVCQRHLCTENERAYDFHTYSCDDGGACGVCGWSRPTRDALKTEAWHVEADIDQRGGWTMYSGDAYSTAGGATKVGSVPAHQDLRILEHADVGGVLWVRVCSGTDIQNPIGWISTELISIDVFPPPPSPPPPQKVRIKVSSGRARSGAGKYPIIEYVKFDETFYVYDAKEDTDGNLWFQIKVDGKEAWISEDLVEFVD